MEDYTVKEELGKGATSEVYLAINKHTQQSVALKVFTINQLNQDYMLAIYEKELHILNMLPPSSSFITLAAEPFNYTDSANSSKYVLPLRYASKGNLTNILKKEFLNERHARYIFKQILSAIELMHNSLIAHRDIKLDNILVDETNQISLTDFGYAVCGQTPAFLKIGTVGYIAPEVYLNQRYDPFCADIFSLGVVLFNMVTGENLLDDDDGPGNPIYKQLRNGSPSAFWKLLEKRCPRVKIMSIKLRMMLSSMLHPEPEKRSKLGSIKSHSWLKGDTITPLEFSQWVGRVKNEDDTIYSHIVSPNELYKFQGTWKIVSSILMGIWN